MMYASAGRRASRARTTAFCVGALALIELAAPRARAEEAPDAAAAPPTPLTLDAALAFFDRHGFDLLVAEAAVAGAEGDVEAAGAVANPALSIGYGRSFYVGCAACATPPGAITAAIGDQGAIADTLSGKRRLRVDVARAALDAARLGRADAARALRYQVEAQFEAVVVAQQTLALAAEIAGDSATVLDKVEDQARQGKIADADVLRVRVAALEAQQARDQAEQAVHKARADLAFLLGVRGAAPELVVDAPELLRYARPAALAGATEASLYTAALAARPDLAADEAQLRGAGAALALARRQRVPDLSLSLGYTQQGAASDAVTPPTISLTVTGTLPVFYRQAGEIHRAQAGVRTQAVMVERTSAAIADDVATAWADLTASEALVRRMEDGTLLATAKAARDAVYVQWQKGAASVVDYLLAQSQYITTSGEYLDDVAGYWTAVFELERAVGRPLR